MAELTDRDALIVVDVQRDFCPGGSLAVPEADAVIPVLNRWISKAAHAGAAIAASRDWHPPDHISFTQRGGAWPPHCIQESQGAAFHPDLKLPDETWIITKGDSPEFDQYSALDRTGLGHLLKDHGIRRVWVGGLAMDVCVKATVCDACREGFETHLIRNATRAVNVAPGDDQRALDEMIACGTIIDEED